MLITLDLFGFQKKVDVEYCVYKSGCLKTIITSPIGEILEKTILSKLCLISDTPYVELMFYRDYNDDIWRVK